MFFHKFHLVSLSPWPIYLSFSIFHLILSFLLFFKYKIVIFMILALFNNLSIMGLWWRDTKRENLLGFQNFDVCDGFKFGMILFIFSEIMFFMAWFWAFFHNSLIPANDLGSHWPPFFMICLEPFQIPLLNTFILLSSGATVTLAHHSLINGKNFFLSLFTTIMLGMIFTFFQFIEYSDSFFSLSENSYSSSFFVTTGFHGLHVMIGTIFLFVTTLFYLSNDLNKWQHLSFEFAIWYWHFVDVVWLFLFFFMYWWSF